MTKLEYNTKSAEVTVRESESKLNEARRNREQGIRKAQAEYDMTIQKLQTEIDRLEIALIRERAWLELCRAEQSQGFQS